MLVFMFQVDIKACYVLMCYEAAGPSVTTPSGKNRLTKSRRTTVASSKPSEAKMTKITSSSSDVETANAEADAQVGRKTGGRHGSKTAAAAVSLATTAVSPVACILLC